MSHTPNETCVWTKAIDPKEDSCVNKFKTRAHLDHPQYNTYIRSLWLQDELQN